MRPLTNREKRTVRIGTVGIVIYLFLFGGVQGWNYFGKKRAEYQQLVQEAQGLRQQVQRYQERVAVIKKLMESSRLDPAKLTRAAVVAQASAAIQKAAISNGIPVGPIRESPARPSSRELASVQLEAMGPVPAAMGFLHQLESLGYPLVIDSVQISSPPGPQGQGPQGQGPIKLNLTIVILDFDQWKKEGVPNA